jgi:hypothetical protein
MSKRAFWVKPLFGEAKDFHRLRRFRLRGLLKVNIEGVMIACCTKSPTTDWQLSLPSWLSGLPAKSLLRFRSASR